MDARVKKDEHLEYQKCYESFFTFLVAAAATFYSAKSRQELGLGGLSGLASRSGPGRFNYKLIENYYLYLIRPLMIHTFCLKALF